MAHTKGRIFDIQRYSIHDGNGIRTIVFLKGCVLRCLWCCNPESQKFEKETMMVDGKPKVMGRDVTVEDVMEIVEKDRNYYRKSGGGMTLSGGRVSVSLSLRRRCSVRRKNAGSALRWRVWDAPRMR